VLKHKFIKDVVDTMHILCYNVYCPF